MKNFYIKIWKYVIAFCLVITLAPSIFAVNLVVSGFPTGAYSGANGTYVPTAQKNSHDCWVHSSGGYYIYYNAACSDWEIYNVNTVNNCADSYNYFAYSSDGASPVPVGLSWSRNGNLMTNGSISVTEESAPLVPEIDVKGNSYSIVDGNPSPNFQYGTKFGSCNITSASVSRTYIIENVGTGALTITGVTITGANASDFTITTNPTGTVGAGATATLVVEFDPTAVGDKNATITINNDDTNEGVYDFSINGFGYNPANLTISGITTPAAANGTYIHQGVTNNFEYWKYGSYYLYNDGNNWFIDNDLSSTSALFYSANNGQNPSPLYATSWTAETGAGTALVATAVPEADINLLGNSLSIVTNDATPSLDDYTDFGSVDVSTGTLARNFTIQNTGGATLTLSGASPYVTISGTNASDFSITTIPSASIAAAGSTPFQITFNPSANGTRTATVTITSNDPDEGTYSFVIQGYGYYAQNLSVSGITSPSAANGLYVHQGVSNNFQYWKYGSYYLYNDKTGWYFDTDLSSASALFYSANNLLAPSPLTVTSWTAETGTGTPLLILSAPEINVQGNGVSIISGDVTPSTADYTDFGSVNITSATLARTFTIQNTGNAALNLTGIPKVSISGTNASDFTVTTQPTTPVAATSGTTTFTVQFDPSATGIRTAAISIANNDNDENPYNFSIQGTGVLTPTVTGISPTSGLTLGGTTVTITGTNLTGATSVMFGSNAATGFVVNSATQITATSPARSAGTIHVTVTTAGGTSATIANDQFTYLTPGTWTGLAHTSHWTDAGNWSDNQVPTATSNVYIPGLPIGGYLPMIFPGDAIDCNNLTLDNGALEILSSASGTGSLIVHGTVSGKLWTDIYLTANQWHIVTPSVDGTDIGSFLSSGYGISSKVNGAITTYAIADYNEGSNTWNSYFTNSKIGTFSLGKGYIMRLDNPSYVSFYGDIVTGNKTINLTKTGSEGWNCIGNPYTSAIGMNASATSTENFLTKNSNIFDPSYACVYIWDGISSTYKILGNLPSGLSGERSLAQNYVQTSQAFFVKTKDASQIASFTPAMQSHQSSLALKSSQVSWPGFELTATLSNVKASTVVAFNNSMTKGLDPTYDAGLLRGTSGLSLYSRLVDDNGVDFAIQCLPESYPSLVIPLGLDCKTGGEITFSAETVELPAACSVILEDKTTKTFTSLAGGATYKVTVPAGATGTGRFYIHTNDVISGVSDLPSAATFSLKVYPANGEIIIEGEVSNQAKASLFDLNGKKLGAYALQGQNRNTISVAGVVSGVYLLSVTDSGKRFTTKIVIE